MECKEDHLLEAAKALLLLSSMPQPDRPPASTTHLFTPYPHPPEAVPVTSIENVHSVFLPPWGFRSRRSRYTGKSKRERDEGPSSSAAAAAAVASCGHRSPDTPLDLGAASDPCTSGSDGFPSSSEFPPFKRCRVGEPSAPGCDAHIKVSAVERSPLVDAVRPSSLSIKRHGRKKTISELQAEERFLVEEKKQLTKLLESERIEKEAIFAENRRLLSKLARSQIAPREAEFSKLKFLLPDLNEPGLEHLEPDCADN